MAITNLTGSVVNAIQTGMLERVFQESLRARLGYRAIADKEVFPLRIGQTLTMTRPGLRAPVTQPLAPAANNDITSGIVPSNFSVEQFTLSIAQYGDAADNNLLTDAVTIASVYLRNAQNLAEQAARSLDGLAATALFSAYAGGNTYAATAASGNAITVASTSGFAPGTVTNVGTVLTANSTSNVLTFTTNPTAAQYAPISSTTAASVFFPNAITSAANLVAGNTLTMQTLLEAKAQLEMNNIPPLAGGYYRAYGSPAAFAGLYADPQFQNLYRGTGTTTDEYRRGIIAEMLGIELVSTNMAPTLASLGAGPINQIIVVGRGALIEGNYTAGGYGQVMAEDDKLLITIVDGIAHVTRPPLDTLQQVFTSAWSWTGGFVAPTDTLTTPTVLPTANLATYKRGVTIMCLNK